MNNELSFIKSNINKSSTSYKNNLENMKALIEILNSEMEKALFQGDEKSVQRVRKYNRLLTRERIELLLDQDSPFLEIAPLAGWGTDCYRLGGSVIGGIGLVSGKLCLILGLVGSVKGGAGDWVTLQKVLRLNEIAGKNNLNVINLVETAGANLGDQAKIFNYSGEIFLDISRRSKRGLKTISIVFGSSAGGGAYMTGISDYTIMIKDNSKLFLGGPLLVKYATGEIVDDESLGGSKMHSRTSGVSDYLAENEEDAIRIARELFYYINEPIIKKEIKEDIVEPLYSSEELIGIISADSKIPYDSREIIARIVDGSRFFEFKKEFGITLVTGYAKILGHTVGIIANNGVLFSDSAKKASQFVQLCNQNKTPIIFMQNVTGFIVGKQYEEEGIIKHGANMLNTVANSEVPLITIIIGSSYGAANFAMCGKSLEPRFIFSYPNSKMALMGSEQINGVLSSISSDNSKMMDSILEQINKQSSPYYATGQLWDDGIIDPRQTRNYLGICLAVFNQDSSSSNNTYGVFRV